MPGESDDNAADKGKDRRNREPRVALHPLTIDKSDDSAKNKAESADGGDQASLGRRIIERSGIVVNPAPKE